MVKIAVETIGCKSNRYDSTMIEASLQSLSVPIHFVDSSEAADMLILNTCTVTGRADSDARKLIRRFKREHPDAIVIVTGCYNTVFPEELDIMEEVDYRVDNRDKSDLHRLIEAIASKAELHVEGKRWSSDGREGKSLLQPINALPRHLSRPYIKIQEGCSRSCTYCIVPRARGKSASMRPEHVLELINAYQNLGAREVVLTGICMGSYGKTLDPEGSLLRLLEFIRAGGTSLRIRLSSIEPMDMSRDLIRFLKDWDAFCPHFHVPLQSGSDGILKSMNRPYSRAAYRNVIEQILTEIPDATIGSDVIVGFPGETPERFDETYHFIPDCPLHYLHVFSFSPRPTTPSFLMDGQVDEAEKKARVGRLSSLGKAKRMAHFRAQIGKTLDVLVENRLVLSGTHLRGLSANYIPIVFQGPSEIKGEIVPVTVEKIMDGLVHGVWNTAPNSPEKALPEVF